MQKITILCCLLLPSCALFQKEKKYTLRDFPVKPELVIYKSPPVVKKTNEHFVVTNELILNSTLLTDYYKRIESWKVKKNIR